ncbi:hypothetical protein COBT_000791 [Conglomerata obtusa]
MTSIKIVFCKVPVYMHLNLNVLMTTFKLICNNKNIMFVTCSEKIINDLTTRENNNTNLNVHYDGNIPTKKIRTEWDPTDINFQTLSTSNNFQPDNVYFINKLEPKLHKTMQNVSNNQTRSYEFFNRRVYASPNSSKFYTNIESSDKADFIGPVIDLNSNKQNIASQFNDDAKFNYDLNLNFTDIHKFDDIYNNLANRFPLAVDELEESNQSFNISNQIGAASDVDMNLCNVQTENTIAFYDDIINIGFTTNDVYIPKQNQILKDENFLQKEENAKKNTSLLNYVPINEKFWKNAADKKLYYIADTDSVGNTDNLIVDVVNKNITEEYLRAYIDRLKIDIVPNILTSAFYNYINIIKSSSINENNSYQKQIKQQNEIIKEHNKIFSIKKHGSIEQNQKSPQKCKKRNVILYNYAKDRLKETLDHITIPDRISNTVYFSIDQYIYLLANNSLNILSLHQSIVNFSRSYFFDKDDHYWLSYDSYIRFIQYSHYKTYYKYTKKELFHCCDVLNQFLPKKLVKIIEVYFSTIILQEFENLHFNMKGLVNFFVKLQPTESYFKDDFDSTVKHNVDQILSTRSSNMSVLFPQLDLFTYYMARNQNTIFLIVNDTERFVYICFLQILSIVVRQEWHLLFAEICKGAKKIEGYTKSKNNDQECKNLKKDINYMARIFFTVKLLYEDILAFVLCPILEKDCFQRYINMIMLQKLDYLKKFERPFCQKIKETFKVRFGFVTKINKLFFAVEVYRNFYNAQIANKYSNINIILSSDSHLDSNFRQNKYSIQHKDKVTICMYEFQVLDKIACSESFIKFFYHNARFEGLLKIFCYYFQILHTINNNPQSAIRLIFSYYSNTYDIDLCSLLDIETFELRIGLNHTDQIQYCQLSLSILNDLLNNV